MKFDEVDVILIIMALTMVGVGAGGVMLFEHYCEVFGTTLTILVGAGFLTMVILVGYINHLVEKYRK
jgi:hypothetical protein